MKMFKYSLNIRWKYFFLYNLRELQKNVTTAETLKWLFRYNNNATGNPAFSLVQLKINI